MMDVLSCVEAAVSSTAGVHEHNYFKPSTYQCAQRLSKSKLIRDAIDCL